MSSLFLAGCGNQTTINSCPIWPDPKKEAADELERNCYPEEKCPAFWEWMNRLYILKDQLKVSEETNKKRS
jgi:hypothetical protein